MTLSQLYQYCAYLALVIIVAGAELLHLVPPGTLAPVLLFVVGHITGNIPTALAINANTLATNNNTMATLQTNDSTTQPLPHSVAVEPVVVHE